MNPHQGKPGFDSMGWAQRLLQPRASRNRRGYAAGRQESKGRSWVSPQFLGLATGLGLLAVGAYVWAQSGQGPGGLGDPAPAQHGGSEAGPVQRVYVGFQDVAQLQAAPDVGGCNLDCRVLRAWYDWLEAHPGAVIVERTAVYEAGVLLGYWVDYRDA
jgi:hypothetical protein